MSHTFARVDPATVKVGPNVRLDPRLDQDFVASVRERGVLEPVLLYRGADGTLAVLEGQRRTLAARQTGQRQRLLLAGALTRPVRPTSTTCSAPQKSRRTFDRSSLRHPALASKHLAPRGPWRNTQSC